MFIWMPDSSCSASIILCLKPSFRPKFGMLLCNSPHVQAVNAQQATALVTGRARPLLRLMELLHQHSETPTLR